MGREELKWRQLKTNVISSQGPHFSPRSAAKTNDQGTNLSKNGIYSETSINDPSEKRTTSLQRPNYLPPIHSSIELMYF